MSYLYTKYKFLNWVNANKINWEFLSMNKNAIDLLEANPNKINWQMLSRNLNIFEINYEYYEKTCNTYKEELIAKVFQPEHVIRHLEKYNYNLSEDEYFDVHDFNDFG